MDNAQLAQKYLNEYRLVFMMSGTSCFLDGIDVTKQLVSACEASGVATLIQLDTNGCASIDPATNELRTFEKAGNVLIVENHSPVVKSLQKAADAAAAQFSLRRDQLIADNKTKSFTYQPKRSD